MIFQEPEFTPGDKTFLESRGHVVVDDPLGFEAIGEDPGGCVVAGFHLYVPVYKRALGEGALPRVFIGTGWDVWDQCVRPPFPLLASLLLLPLMRIDVCGSLG